MARALVVYESVFGDTEVIARAVAEGIAVDVPVDVVAAREAPKILGADIALLVVGGPTHAFGMPRPATREGAVEEHGAHLVDTTTGLHEWLDVAQLPPGLRVAAFDTRMDHPKLATMLNHAAKSEEKLLKGLGATVVAQAEHFVVTDVEGPLAEGEEDRARQWGHSLAEIVTTGARP